MASLIPARLAATPARPLCAAALCFAALFLAGAFAVDPVSFLMWANYGLRQAWLLILGFFAGRLLPDCRPFRPARLPTAVAQALALLVAAVMVRHTSAPFFYLTIYPDAHRITSLAAFLAGAAAGAAVFLARSRGPAPRLLERIARVDIPLPALVFGSSLLFLPEVWAFVADNWNCSGFMDSQVYDHISHDIATGLRPFGSSYYMPLYQYGLAALYYAFGHFFWLAQVSNGLAASATLACVGLCAWNIFKDRRAVLLALILAATTPTLRYTPILPQIENWYIPLFALTVLLFTVIWNRPTMANAVAFGLSLGLLLNTRNQGAFYVLAASLAPLLAAPRGGRKKAVLLVLTVWLTVGATLVPWTLRNAHVEGRLSPGSEQGPLQMAIMNDKRIGFYGLRFDINYFDILEEYRRRFPDTAERIRECSREAREKLLEDPAWTLRAVFWRGLAFYGLAPAAVWSWSPADSPEPVIDWPKEARSLFSLSSHRYIALFYLVGSLAGLAMRPRRINLALALLALGNFLVVVFVGFNEERIHYPNLVVHLLLALSIFFSPRLGSQSGPTHPEFTKRSLLLLPAVVLLGAAFLVLAHQAVGKHFASAPLAEPVSIDPTAGPDPGLPVFSELVANLPPNAAPSLRPGQRVLLTLRLSNDAAPPTFAAFPGSPLKFIPGFANDPLRERFHYAALVPSSGFYPLVSAFYYGETVSTAGVSFFGARSDTPLREGDLVSAEAEALLVPPLAPGPPDQSQIINPWFRIVAMRRLGPDTDR